MPLPESMTDCSRGECKECLALVDSFQSTTIFSRRGNYIFHVGKQQFGEKDCELERLFDRGAKTAHNISHSRFHLNELAECYSDREEKGDH